MGRKRTAHQHQRTFSIGEQFCKLVQILSARASHGHGARLHQGAYRGSVKNVFGQDHRDWAWGAGFGQMEGARNGLARLDRF